MKSLSPTLTAAQHLKFELLCRGLAITPPAAQALHELNGERSLTPHDYASTSGLILALDDDVWVNAPISLYNSNFVSATPFRLDWDSGFVVRGAGLESRARYWPQPAYHGTSAAGSPLNNYAVTHGDRVRLSPIRSCAMTCTFCNIPYDDPMSVYALKSVDTVLAAARTAFQDPLQPARHLLISGGTPKPKDVGWMRDFYEAVLLEFSGTQVDLMMVPLPGLFNLPRLRALGLHELSINLELFNTARALKYASHKYHRGQQFYLDFIERAGQELGPGRARSMLMVGLEPLGDTLAGVRAIAERGGTPVLSPFRPDPATPLRDLPPPTPELLRETYLRATDIVTEFGAALGPDCPPCSHNTINLLGGEGAGAHYPHPVPHLLGPA